MSGVQLSRGAWSLPLVSQATWLPFGPLSSLQFGNGQTLSKAWDQNYWPDAVGGSVLDYDFSTDEVGNIVRVGSVSEGTRQFGYDRLDRLTAVRDANQALIEAYTYDPTGNRTGQQLGSNPATSYSYPSDSHRLTSVGSSARSVDAVGNTLSGIPGYETDSASYDARNRLVRVGSPSAQLLANYNGRGERVLASQGSPAPALPTTSAAWTQASGARAHVHDEQGQLISSLIGGNPLRYEEIVWIDNIPVGRVLSSTSAVLEVHAIHSDHLNTPRALANAQSQGGQAAGTVVWRWRLNATSNTGSNAFGAQPAEENPDGNATSIRFDLRFPGQQYDASVGLSYNYFRDYEAGTGRYVESDPIGLKGGVSTYGYVGGDPMRFVDPLGESKYVDCGGGCRLRIETDPHKGLHAHWECRNGANRGSWGCILIDGRSCEGSPAPSRGICKCLEANGFPCAPVPMMEPQAEPQKVCGDSCQKKISVSTVIALIGAMIVYELCGGPAFN